MLELFSVAPFRFYYRQLSLFISLDFVIIRVLRAVRAQDSDCPEKNGLFADSIQCDRYYECSDFVITEKLCPDGLVFADLNGNGRCDFPFNVDCKDRPELRKLL